MPDPSTTRLGLYKSKSDGSELVNYSQDIGQNLDKLDTAVGFQAATSTTRPSAPFSGKPIFETDTSYRTYFSNGTSPASGSWVQIPNSSSTFAADLDLTSGRQLNIGASNSVASLAIVNTTTNDDLLSSRITGDTQSRFLIDADGATYWGAGGSTAPDVKLYRSAADTLKTDDSLIVGIDLTVTGNINSASNMNMGAWASWTPTWSTTTGLHLPSYGNATVDCRYARIGRTIVYYMSITFGSTTNFGASAATSDNWTFSLPTTARAAGVPVGYASYYVGSTTKAIAGIAQTSDTATMRLYVGSGDVANTSSATLNGGLVDSLSPFTWASGDILNIIGQYEAAS